MYVDEMCLIIHKYVLLLVLWYHTCANVNVELAYVSTFLHSTLTWARLRPLSFLDRAASLSLHLTIFTSKESTSEGCAEIVSNVLEVQLVTQRRTLF